MSQSTNQPAKLPTRFFHYGFEGLKEKVTIEATTKEAARAMLDTVIESHPQLQNRLINSESVSSPVSGVSQKTVNGKTMIWQGSRGWQPKQ